MQRLYFASTQAFLDTWRQLKPEPLQILENLSIITLAVRPFLLLCNRDEPRLPENFKVAARCWLGNTQRTGDKGHADAELDRVCRPLIGEVVTRRCEQAKYRHANLTAHRFHLC